MDVITEKYMTQMRFKPIGSKGQRLLSSSKVTIVGVGALGSLVGMQLSRAGVGNLKIIDHDVCSIGNLHRQFLFTETDAERNRLKVEAACAHLLSGNHEVSIEGRSEKLTSANENDLLMGSDLIIDATDNFDARMVINEWCYKTKTPWIYGGVCGSRGMSYNFLNRGGPCFRCVFQEQTSAKDDAFDQGVISMIVGAVASVQSSEAVKILLQSPEISNKLKIIDLWKNKYLQLSLIRNPECSVCGKPDDD